jgi:Transposase and inactivated derivatives
MLTAKGVKPVCIAHQVYQSTWLFGAFSPITGDHLLIEFPNCNSTNFQLFLNEVSSENPKTLIIMVLDNGAFHKAKMLNIPDNIKLVFLPPYSPELNPAERMWARLKRSFTNKIFHSLEQVSLFLDDAVNDISNASVISTCAYPYIFFDPFWNEK